MPARGWSPWWAVLLSLAGLASLAVPVFYSALWVLVDQDGMGAVGAVLGAFGRRGLLASLVVALTWLVFLVRGGMAPFGLGLGMTVGGWAWILWG